MLALASRLQQLAVTSVRYCSIPKHSNLSTKTQPILIPNGPQGLDALIRERNAQLMDSIRARGLPEFLTPHQTWVHSIKDNKKLDHIMVLDPVVFNFKPRIDILNDVIRWHRACQRQGNVAHKNRAEKRGGGHKPWPQKKTGRARQGSIRAPHWKKGGRAHARKPQDHSYPFPLNLQHLGMCTLLTLRLLQGDLVVVDKLLPVTSGQDVSEIPDDFILSLLNRYKCKSIYFADEFKDPTFENLIKQYIENVGEDAPRLFYYPSSENHCAYDMIRCNKLIVTVAGLRLYEAKLAKRLRNIDY